MSYYKDEEERRKRIAEHLKVLPQATLDEIEKECATGDYTHVHILSHGVPAPKGDDERFGLALHDRVNPAQTDIVDGERLAKALRPPRRDGRTGFARPVIVTLAACNAGNPGEVTSPGASIAHALHAEGVPLVVASQFPLSFAGSVIMTRVLYRGFLTGEDPRQLLVYLRRELLTQCPEAHDWASIVAYASFPQKFDELLANMQLWQTFRRFEAAINHIDRPQAPDEKIWDNEMKRVEEARRRFDLLLDKAKESANGKKPEHQDESKVSGIVASAEKRIAELRWRMAVAWNRENPERPPDKDPEELDLKDEIDVRDGLLNSRKFYEETFKRNRSQVWALVQVLALTAVVRKWNPEPEHERSVARWELARRFSEEELGLGNPERLSWANANLMELYILASVFPETEIAAEEAQSKAIKYAMAFRSVTELKSVNLHSTRRQMLRYINFFRKVNEDMQPAADLAEKVLKILPESQFRPAS